MVRWRRSPQEKKRLSLDRDTPLSAKYPKGFRKQWPRKKAIAERAARHARRQALAVGGDVAAVARRVVRKWPQAKLKDTVAANKQHRAALRDQPRKSPAARARRARRRGSGARTGSGETS